MTSVPVPFTEDDGLAFITRQHVRARDNVGYSMAIADRVTDRAVGSIGLRLRDLDAGRASVGYWIVPSARGNHAAGHALRAVARWALGVLRIPRLELFVEPGNTASIRTAQHAGFVQVFLPVRSAIPYGKRFYHPIYEAAVEQDLVISLHFGGAPGNPPVRNPISSLDPVLAFTSSLRSSGNGKPNT